MPAESLVQFRDRAIVAFLILSGARDGSIPTFKLKYVDMNAGTVSQNARDVKTKGAKTFPSVFFPVGEFFVEIFGGYDERLKAKLLFGPDDPLFPAPQMGHDAERGFIVVGLSRNHWRNATPIRRIVRTALRPPALIIPTRTKCAKRLLVSVSKRPAHRRNGKPGRKISGMKMK